MNQSKVLPFERGDVIEFCDDLFIVIRGGCHCGVVGELANPKETINFWWDLFQDQICKFVRKSTPKELEIIENIT